MRSSQVQRNPQTSYRIFVESELSDTLARSVGNPYAKVRSGPWSLGAGGAATAVGHTQLDRKDS